MSSVTDHSPPSFYAVYLLRSLASANSTKTYIGSSPDPARRKRQHNGQLTGGAWKTRTARPWETVALVWGFGSKIAALQVSLKGWGWGKERAMYEVLKGCICAFEWAWQKPHLSRHLRTRLPVNHTNDGAESSTSVHALTAAHTVASNINTISVPLFPLSSRSTTAPMSNGKPYLSAGGAPARLLVLDALMRSEPFAHWGLRITFFDEWAWGAWRGLQRQPRCEPAETGNSVLSEHAKEAQLSRGGRRMPPDDLVGVTTDFSGVDGARKCLTLLDEHARKALKLPEGSDEGRSISDALGPQRAVFEPTATVRDKDKGKSKAASFGAADEWNQDLPGFARLPGHWTRALPRSANARAVRLTWRDIHCAPRQPPLPEIAPVASFSEESQGSEQAGEPSASAWALPCSATQQLPFRCNDDDLSEIAYERLQHLLRGTGSSLQMYAEGREEDAMRAAIVDASSVTCSLCRDPVDLRDHLSYALCPAPMTEIRPISPHWSALSKRSTLARPARSEHCDSVFHLPCLAQDWLRRVAESQSSWRDNDEEARGLEVEGAFLLPTHGRCPTCSKALGRGSASEGHTRDSGQTSRETLWSEVVKSTFRRKELAIAKLAQMRKDASKAQKTQAALLEKARAGKRRKKGSAAEGTCDVRLDTGSMDNAGLLDRLDRLAHAKAGKSGKSGSARSGTSVAADRLATVADGQGGGHWQGTWTSEGVDDPAATAALQGALSAEEAVHMQMDAMQSARPRPKPQFRSSREMDPFPLSLPLPSCSSTAMSDQLRSSRPERPHRSNSVSCELSGLDVHASRANGSARATKDRSMALSLLPALDELTNASCFSDTVEGAGAGALLVLGLGSSEAWAPS
ncbi:giy-yig type nuclease catalytic domain containing protein [Ceraceosorus bombacis]|uniref:Giy-yig type nuclease catalytic domain containing protein n=1 Tax=Ceraceosorus bombacis TaxID=401625 RepID=A0A0P1BR85_9BASI|nr:giy-yig type nuclease catalytic domain containing protein [Ceraceosorus bombacis]